MRLALLLLSLILQQLLDHFLLTLRAGVGNTISFGGPMNRASCALTSSDFSI